MTNEKLVLLLQTGEWDRVGELRGNVERFVWQQAGRRVLLGTNGVTVEALYQSGYLALVDAVESYDVGWGMAFIGWLAVVLKNAFNAVERGGRTGTTIEGNGGGRSAAVLHPLGWPDRWADHMDRPARCLMPRPMA